MAGSKRVAGRRTRPISTTPRGSGDVETGSASCLWSGPRIAMAATRVTLSSRQDVIDLLQQLGSTELSEQATSAAAPSPLGQSEMCVWGAGLSITSDASPPSHWRLRLGGRSRTSIPATPPLFRALGNARGNIVSTSQQHEGRLRHRHSLAWSTTSEAWSLQDNSAY
jgi:hypothetical protein